MDIQEELAKIDLLVKVVDMVMKEAQEKGDSRWVEAERQINNLWRKRAELLKQWRSEQGLPEPEAVVIQATLGSTQSVGMEI